MLKNLEASTSNFNNLLDQLDNSTKNVKNNFISVARSYLKRIDTDNLQQDFSEAVKVELSDAKKEIRNSTNQAREENKEYKKIIDERLASNDELISKYNKSINAMTKGITSLFFVIVMIALVSFVTGPIGEFFGVAHLYQFIQKFIDTHETPWRYLIGILYLLPYVCFAGIMWLVAKTLDVIR